MSALMNTLQPKSITCINYDDSYLAKTENIQQFFEAGQKFGLKPSDLFEVEDLIKGNNMASVANTIVSLANLSLELKQRHPHYRPELNYLPEDSLPQALECYSPYSTYRSIDHSDSRISTVYSLIEQSSHESLVSMMDDSDKKSLLHQFGDQGEKEIIMEEETSAKENDVFNESVDSAQGENNTARRTTSYIKQEIDFIHHNFISHEQHSRGGSTTSLHDEDDGSWNDRVAGRTPTLGSISSDTPVIHTVDQDSLCEATFDQDGDKNINKQSTSGDSGYGTARQHPSRDTPSAPLHLASLFNPMNTNDVESPSDCQEKCSSENLPDQSGHAYSSNALSLPVSQINPPVRRESLRCLDAEDMDDRLALQKTASVRSWTSTTSYSSSTVSRLARLSQLSFPKKLPIRQKVPFHTRYQEWTDQKLRKKQSADLEELKRDTDENTPSDTQPRSERRKPGAIARVRRSMIFGANDVDASACLEAPNPSVSSPILKSEPKQKSEPVQKQKEVKTRAKRGQSFSSRLSKTRRELFAALRPDNQPKKTDEIRPPAASRAESSRQIESRPVALSRRKSTGSMPVKRAESGANEETLELLDDAGNVKARYKLGNSIGKGQFGTVHRALNLRTGQMVAIKRIFLDSACKKDLTDVLQEARILQSLAHPNVVKYEGIVQSPEHMNIILEYVENGSLLNTLKAFGSFPENLVASYCLRILEGLCYLHDRHVVHCDLKAANILTTKAGNVKLSDFGVSLNLKLKDTKEGAVAGTPNWMAPEVIELKGASTKSDIWSLGCTIIELYTGKPPYANLIPMTALFRIVEDDRPPLPDSISEELRDFLGLCFKKSPENRPTAAELLNHRWIKNNCSENNITRHRDERMPVSPIPEERPDQLLSPRISSQPFQKSSSAAASVMTDAVNLAELSPLSRKTTASTLMDEIEPSKSQSTPHVAKSSRTSVLANKFQERHAMQEKREHHFVKGSFGKAAIRCKACQLPIKHKALVCEECGLICHDKCKTSTSCIAAYHAYSPEGDYHDQSPPSTSEASYTTRTEIAVHGPDNLPHTIPQTRRSTCSHEESIPEPIRPTPSMSSQLRQRTRKLSKVLTSGRQSSQQQQQQQRRMPQSSRSCDTLANIREDTILPSTSSGFTAASAESEPAETTSKNRKGKRRPSHPDDCIIS
ncbi:hypothetical protein EC973_002213 [Apophysomyces ossiformis]|uniref:non-specific serine/threonine protein kinase n=1 Tax=Apophysomyces ossiformis TaxID=679940 RepID=A0A8H7ES11_9FUNG|nr:hypothetical protein EC973_002213 [Apophysomyces ossiformis]